MVIHAACSSIVYSTKHVHDRLHKDLRLAHLSVTIITIIFDFCSVHPEKLTPAVPGCSRFPGHTSSQCPGRRCGSAAMRSHLCRGNAFDEDVQRSLQFGMNAHLTKPVEPDHLFKTLGELIWETENQNV